jgi:hypothetical protein
MRSLTYGRGGLWLNLEPLNTCQPPMPCLAFPFCELLHDSAICLLSSRLVILRSQILFCDRTPRSADEHPLFNNSYYFLDPIYILLFCKLQSRETQRSSDGRGFCVLWIMNYRLGEANTEACLV